MSINLTVAKFGGTSVADYQAMLRCAQIIKSDTSNRLVVVSASAGVTNHLVRLSQKNVSIQEQLTILESIKDTQLNITKHLDCEQDLNRELDILLGDLAAYANAQSLIQYFLLVNK